MKIRQLLSFDACIQAIVFALPVAAQTAQTAQADPVGDQPATEESSEGVVIDLDEQARIVENLGEKHILILRNHGLLTAGRAVVEALQLMLDLKRTCQGQLAAMAGGSELSYLSDAAIERTADVAVTRYLGFGRDWAALLRLVDRVSPGYRN